MIGSQPDLLLAGYRLSAVCVEAVVFFSYDFPILVRLRCAGCLSAMCWLSLCDVLVCLAVCRLCCLRGSRSFLFL